MTDPTNTELIGLLPVAEYMAQRFHELCEDLAPVHGYKTREASAKPWADVPAANKELMVDVCDHLRVEWTTGAKYTPNTPKTQ